MGLVRRPVYSPRRQTRPREASEPRSTFFFFKVAHKFTKSSFKRCQNTRGRPRRAQTLPRSSAPRRGLVDSSPWVTGLGPGSCSPPALRLTASKAGGGGSRGISFLMTQRLADRPTVDTHLRVCFSPCGPTIALFLRLPEPTAGMEKGGEWREGGGRGGG